MRIATIQTLSELTSLEKEWNDLLAVSAIHVPFLRHEYLVAWWQGLGGGEWSDCELFVLTTRDDQGKLMGIAPMFQTENRDGEPALMLLGSVEISDYLDVIARPEDLPEFIRALLAYLEREDIPGAHLLDWYNLLESSPTIPVIKKMAEKQGWDYSEEPLQHCPYIPLPGDWEKYICAIDKKQRHEIRRKMRRSEEFYLPVKWYIAQDGDHLEQQTDDFLNLMAKDADKAKFLTPAMRQQMHSIVQAAHKAGWLQLAFIEVNGEKAAGYLNFDYMNHVWVYNSGLDFSYRELSPGWVLLGYLLEWANENKRQYFDFMRGDEQYKYRFGAIDRRVMHLTVQKNPSQQ
jgi:CelD/BcsL family acetyltransferase involved in cellulose biosynthesis